MEQWHCRVTSGGILQAHVVRDSLDAAETYAVDAHTIYRRLGKTRATVVAVCKPDCAMRSR